MKKSPLKKFAKRSRAIIPVRVRLEVKERSGGRCEFVWGENRCKGQAVEMHHVLARSAGGKHAKENLLHACFLCHQYTKYYPKDSIDRGFVKLMGVFK